MTHASPLRPDPAALAALAASLRVWLLAMLHWLMTALGVEERQLPAALKRELRGEIADVRDEVLNLVAAMAFYRLRPARRTHVATLSRADPHRSRIAARRALSRGLIARGGALRLRIEALLDALRNLDALVIGLLRRILRGAKGAWRVAAIDEACGESVCGASPWCDTS